jgi:hypothetical protein
MKQRMNHLSLPESGKEDPNVPRHLSRWMNIRLYWAHRPVGGHLNALSVTIYRKGRVSVMKWLSRALDMAMMTLK